MANCVQGVYGRDCLDACTFDADHCKSILAEELATIQSRLDWLCDGSGCRTVTSVKTSSEVWYAHNGAMLRGVGVTASEAIDMARAKEQSK